MLSAPNQLSGIKKMPKQSRGKATVEAILQAATYILIERGWDALTTNSVAERAGVNIASLYQYFPNKEALIVELHRRYSDSVQSCSTSIPFDARGDSDLLSAVEQAISLFRDKRELFRLFEELPRSCRREGGRPKQGQSPVTPGPPPDLNLPDAELSLYIAKTAAESVLREMTLSRPDLLAHPRLPGEMVALLRGYLLASRDRDGRNR